MQDFNIGWIIGKQTHSTICIYPHKAENILNHRKSIQYNSHTHTYLYTTQPRWKIVVWQICFLWFLVCLFANKHTRLSLATYRKRHAISKTKPNQNTHTYFPWSRIFAISLLNNSSQYVFHTLYILLIMCVLYFINCVKFKSNKRIKHTNTMQTQKNKKNYNINVNILQKDHNHFLQRYYQKLAY